MTVMTGHTPHYRAHLWFRLEGCATADQLEAVNAALKKLLGSDDVEDPGRLMRLAGTVSYPKPDKVARGYIPELVTLHIRKDAPSLHRRAIDSVSQGRPQQDVSWIPTTQPNPAAPTKS